MRDHIGLSDKYLSEEKKRADDMFYALQANALTGDVASWLVDLAIRVKRIEDQLYNKVHQVVTPE